ncbi:GcrA family cell cycle regulator [Methylobacterium isbiliense]|uniref:GcrA cell cycle regulator n=1 Tax=Methylobacterium isbiliense TaxID=315478 RepID=A0ABQ4SI83_9HYPH|nr:GcrA family cell cycle regulator [Methylobacterium isbiliense]MDN3622558.1 GcrA family cell cycle regulator [Methylobacterium isbiliense]GJE01458.1 hypothetical protein GMJLKIPL_3389 [Methylobacterium isbiliense]
MPAPWTKPERTALRDMWRKGLPPAVIATSLRARFGHHYRAADIPGRVRDFGFLADHPAAPAEAEPPPAVVSPPPAEEPAARPQPAAWSEQAIDRLKTMWRDGATGPAIAAALTREFGAPRTRNAVMGMVHRLGLKGQQGRLAEEPVASPGEALSEAPQALTSEAEALSCPGESPAEKRDSLQNPTPEPESQHLAAGPTLIFPATNEAAKINTPPDQQASAHPRPAAEPAPPVLTMVRPEPRPANWPPADGIPMADLRWGECRWPVSGFQAVQHRFCAARATGDSPYCAEYRRRATAPREMGRGPGRYPGWVDGGVA